MSELHNTPQDVRDFREFIRALTTEDARAHGVLQVHPEMEPVIPVVPGLVLVNRRLSGGWVFFDYRRVIS